MSTNDSTTTDDNTSSNITTSSTSNKTFYNNISSFLKKTASSILYIFVWFFISAYVLFACKLAQSNLMPTDVNSYPYKDNKPTINPKTLDIFLTMFVTPQMSKKIFFPTNKNNTTFSIIDTIREYKEGSRAQFILTYFISILEDIIACNYGCISYLFNSFNQILPEIVIILLGPILLLFLVIVTYVCNILGFVYSWFANMKWFFKKNMACPSEEKARWKDVSSIFSFRYIFGIILIIIAIITFFMMMPVLFIIPSILIIGALFSIGSYNAVYDKHIISFLTIVKELFKYYKLTIMTVFSYFMLINAFTILGSTSGICCLIVIILIYYHLISIDIFKSVKENNLSPVTNDYRQAIKKSTSSETCNISGGGGTNITNTLKKLAKNM
jgi:hypothetical protein